MQALQWYLGANGSKTRWLCLASCSILLLLSESTGTHWIRMVVSIGQTGKNCSDIWVRSTLSVWPPIQYGFRSWVGKESSGTARQCIARQEVWWSVQYWAILQWASPGGQVSGQASLCNWDWAIRQWDFCCPAHPFSFLSFKIFGNQQILNFYFDV